MLILFNKKKKINKMSLNKSKGNMYPWVTHTHTHLGGECSHKCKYCYVDNPRFGRPERYTGKIRLIEKEFNTNYGSNKVIFIENCNDLFAKDVPNIYILRILNHCKQYPNNTYVFQTKNPKRYSDFTNYPQNTIFGTTIETNRNIPEIGNAPTPFERYNAMCHIQGRKFITIEPVLDFDVDILASWISQISPEFLNLGADSKDHHLPEPTVTKIIQFTEALKKMGIELREKHNLERLKQ